MNSAPAFFFDNTYARLPDRFFVRQPPAVAPKPQVLRVNSALAEALSLDPEALTADILSGATVPEGAEPLAMAYAGRQFGNWVPQLGDGRAVLLGEVIGRDGIRYDIQLKGGGLTPFSRGGDGKAALGPVLREYIVSEAMAGLGIPTTRSLAAALTGEPVYRETVQPGAVLTRVAASHIRVGTFEFFAARKDREALQALVDYALARHYPDRAEEGALGLLDAVVSAQARLIAAWMSVGFIHGVMNTDNMTISGETIDYGPCAFMDTFREGQVFSSIDQFGRYAYGNQPGIAHWNLACFATALVPVIDTDEAQAVAAAQEVIERFPGRYAQAWLTRMRAKLGLSGGEGDAALAGDFLKLMEAQGADFTLAFRALAQDGDARHLFADMSAFDTWAERWRAVRAEDWRAQIVAANPAVIVRNHTVEAALKAAHAKDLGPLDTLVDALRDPFAERDPRDPLLVPPRPEEVVRATFCGT